MENIVQGQWFRGPSADLGEEISQSLRFDSSGYLTRGQSSSGDGLIASNRTFTFSTWFKHGDMGETNIFGIHPSSGNDNWLLNWNNYSSPGGTFGARDYNGHHIFTSSALHKDPNAWYHLFLTCSSGVLSLRVNNVLQNQTASMNHSMDRDFVLGAEGNSGATPMDAYLAETYFIQGTVMNAVNDGFIRLNGDGVYVPDTPTISSYGTNGWHLTYDSSQSNGIGHDSSGNGNHFTASGFNTSAISASNESNDIDFEDTPTKLYATYNKVACHSSQTLSNANLQTSASSYTWAPATIGIPADCGKKFYWEVTIRNNAGNETLGMSDPTQRLGQAPLHGWVFCPPLNSIESDQGNISTVVDTGNTSITTGNGTTYMFAYDADTQNVWIGDSGNWYRRSGASGNGDPANNSNPFLTTSDGCIVDGELYTPATAGSSAGTTAYEVNFGQMPFVHTIPSGFVELHTDNLAEPAIKNGKDHFAAVTYTGNTSSPPTITGLNFQPDLIWIKIKSTTSNHSLYDSVRGATKVICSSDSTNERTDGTVTPTSDGFTVGGENQVIGSTNANNQTYSAWCWKAGGTAVSNSDGSISSNVSANTDAGFSIVTYTGTGATGTVGHGLNSAPEWILIKNRTDTSTNWRVYHIGATATDPEDHYLHLNTDAAAADDNVFNDTKPTASVFSLVASNEANGTNDSMLAYCWHSVEGFSRFGRYRGNGSSDGPFVYLGFQPAFLMIKCSTTAEDWFIHDTARHPENASDTVLRANTTAGESGTGNDIDLISNGFKIRNSIADVNTNAHDYLYMAFAENPFGGKNQPPVTAR